jgi:hypothetical protein
LISYGPNFVADGLGGTDGNYILSNNGPNYLNRVYDPTNGTVSAGDMGVCEYGMFPFSQ